jgi:hypothetical protein
MGRTRLLTDSTIKKQQAIDHVLKKELILERKKHQKKQRMRSDHTKIEVVKSYLALGGNLTLTAGSTNIPYRTLQAWKASEWWKNLVAELKKEEKLTLSAKTKAILERTMELTAERIENGDFIYDQKKGELVRRPLPAKDLHKITVDMMIRRDIIDEATAERVVMKNNDEKLADLAKRFADLATLALEKPNTVVEVTDVIFAEETKRA